MNLGDKIGMGIFMVFAFSFFGGVFYEFFGARNFVEKLYFLGIKLISFKENWGDVQFQISSEPKDTSSGKFKVLSSSTILFRYNQPLISFRVNTPLPFKGVIELKEGVAHVTARIPLSPSIFFGIWLTGWTVGGVAMIISNNQNRLMGLPFLLGGYAFLGAMMGYGYILEKKRLLTVLEEIKSSLNVQSSSSLSRKNEGLISFELKHTVIFVLVVFSLVQGGHHFFFSNALKKITDSSEPRKLRLDDFESAFALGKNQKEKEDLKSQWISQCENKKDYSCRFLGYLKELDKDTKGAFALYVKSCSAIDPHSCYNIISNRQYAIDADIEKAKSILEPLCSSKERDDLKSCCDCYEKEKKNGKF